MNRETFLGNDELGFMIESIKTLTTNVCGLNPAAAAEAAAALANMTPEQQAAALNGMTPEQQAAAQAAAAGKLAYDVVLPSLGPVRPRGDPPSATYRELVMFSEYGDNTDSNITDFNSTMYYAIKSLMIGILNGNGFNKLADSECYAPTNDFDAADLPTICRNQKAIADHTTAVARMPAGGSKMKGGAITPEELKSWQTAVLDDFLFKICGIAEASIEPLIGNLATAFGKLELITQLSPAERGQITNIKLALEYCEIGNHAGKAAFDTLLPGKSNSWGVWSPPDNSWVSASPTGQRIDIYPVRMLLGQGYLLPGYEQLFFYALRIYATVADVLEINLFGFPNTVANLQVSLQEFIFKNSNNSEDYNLILDNPQCAGLYFLAKFLSYNMNQENQNIYLKTTFEPILNIGETPADDVARALNAAFEVRTGGGKGGPPPTSLLNKSSTRPKIVKSDSFQKRTAAAARLASNRATRAAVRRSPRLTVPPQVTLTPVAPAVPPPAPPPAPPAVDPPAPPGVEPDDGLTMNAFKILFSLALYSNFITLNPAQAQANYYSSKLLQLFLATPANIRFLYTSGDIGNWYSIQAGFVTGRIMHQINTIYNKVTASQLNGNFIKANQESVAILSGGKKKQTRKKKKKRKKTRRTKNKKNKLDEIIRSVKKLYAKDNFHL